MHYAIQAPGGFERLYGQPFVLNAVQYPGNTIDLWAPEDLVEIGVLPIVPAAPAPEGEVILSTELVLEEGGLMEVATYGPPPPPPVPQKVSRMQAKQALLAAGLLDDSDAAIAASGDRSLQLYWAETSEFHRNHPAVMAIGTSQGLTSGQLDDLFRAAAQVV
ncbi:hypothetical protein [Caulobacter vibrioides]|uniref:Uncharacterized protein n=1 Tax=Caulobacter phage S2B TaxID=2759120 RepID=A0AAE7ML65_9CAUD|nr:hypothetical protein [Caulobacter vibrioides]QOC54122.1 hypothetical protein [Caulobacter phage S2B]QXZ50198.1 hypothetical protein KZH45_09705 [Caulobacter vibrioides]